MMNINHLEWDSNFFNKKIGEINISNEDVLNTNEDYDLIVTKQLSDFNIELPLYQKTYQETKVIFSKVLRPFNYKYNSNVKDTDLEPKSLTFFKALAYESGKKSRFLLDKNFGKKKFKNLYNQWIINSLNKQFAIKVFFIENENKATAFITLQKCNNIGKIGLLATHPDFQGKGLGKTLLQHVENYCMLNDIQHLEIPTQKENIQACNFYKSQKYEIKDELILKHFWKNDSF